MALPATDTFTTDTTDKALATYSANWTVSSGGFTVSATDDNVRASTDDVECAARWTADTFAAAQYAQIVAGTMEAGIYMGVAVRCGASTWYAYYGNGTDSYLFCYSSGFHQIGSTGAAWTAGKTYRLEVTTDGSGNADLVAKEDGVTKFTEKDSTYKLASGAAGLAGYHNSGTGTGGRGDNWEGGDLGATPLTASVSTTVTLSDTISVFGAYSPAAVVDAVTVTDVIPTVSGAFSPALMADQTAVTDDANGTTAEVGQGTGPPLVVFLVEQQR